MDQAPAGKITEYWNTKIRPSAVIPILCIADIYTFGFSLCANTLLKLFKFTDSQYFIGRTFNQTLVFMQWSIVPTSSNRLCIAYQKSTTDNRSWKDCECYSILMLYQLSSVDDTTWTFSINTFDDVNMISLLSGGNGIPSFRVHRWDARWFLYWIVLLLFCHRIRENFSHNLFDYCMDVTFITIIVIGTRKFLISFLPSATNEFPQSW